MTRTYDITGIIILSLYSIFLLLFGHLNVYETIQLLLMTAQADLSLKYLNNKMNLKSR